MTMALQIIYFQAMTIQTKKKLPLGNFLIRSLIEKTIKLRYQPILQWHQNLDP